MDVWMSVNVLRMKNSERAGAYDVASTAAEAAKAICDAAGPGITLWGGETTVEIKGAGRGGRNQELALRIALEAERRGWPKGWVCLQGGTDGRDGPTEAAGGLVDSGTLARIRSNGGDPEALLADNNSNAALALAVGGGFELEEGSDGSEDDEKASLLSSSSRSKKTQTPRRTRAAQARSRRRRRSRGRGRPAPSGRAEAADRENVLGRRRGRFFLFRLRRCRRSWSWPRRQAGCCCCRCC